MEEVHGSSGACLGGRIFTGEVPIPAARARFRFLALDSGLCACQAGMGDTSGAGRRVDSPALGRIVVFVVVGAVSLEEVGPTKSFPAYLHVKVSTQIPCSGWAQRTSHMNLFPRV